MEKKVFMKVILKKEVQNLGDEGDIVNVKDGYARNYLLPQNMAEIATKGALENRERYIERIQAKAEKLHNEALNVAKQIEEFGELQIAVKAGESGKLFGTVTTKKLAEELKAESGIEIDRKNMTLDAPINHIGEYKLLIKLTSKVKTDLRVVIVASEVLKDRIEEIEEEAANQEDA